MPGKPSPIESHQITPEVHLLTNFTPVPMFGLMPTNAYLVKGKEPYLVDTQMIPERENFVKEVSKLINLEDLRWIFVTHDDSDHIGSLHQLLAKAPNAKVVTNFLAMGRLSIHTPLAPPQVYFLNPGEKLTVGDTEITAFKPALYDTPATTGFYDKKLNVMFSSDSFGCPIAKPAINAADLPAGQLTETQMVWGSVESPWVHHMDRAQFAKNVNAVRAFKPEWIFSSHLPPAKGMIDTYCDNMLKLPDTKPWVGPDQAGLLEMVKKMQAAAGH